MTSQAKHEEMMSKFFERNTPAPSDRESGEDTEIEDAVDASYLLHNRFPATFTDATNSTPRIDSMSCSSFNTDYEGDDESEVRCLFFPDSRSVSEFARITQSSTCPDLSRPLQLMGQVMKLILYRGIRSVFLLPHALEISESTPGMTR